MGDLTKLRPEEAYWVSKKSHKRGLPSITFRPVLTVPRRQRRNEGVTMSAFSSPMASSTRR